MKRHQVLTGAVNQGNHCFSVGGIASFTFWAYGSGCDLVILGVDLKPIHIIPGNIHNNKLIVCLDCSQLCGKIAVSYGHIVVIYRPILKSKLTNNNDIPVFTWEEEAKIDLKHEKHSATILSWSPNGEKLLIGCGDIMLYTPIKPQKKMTVNFSIEDIVEEEEEEDETSVIPRGKVKWKLMWRSMITENLREMNFTPDGEMFASVGFNDTTIKVWHERAALPPFVEEDGNTERSIDFTFFYLVHPQPVVGFSWRKTVPLLEPGSVSNMLISSCCDNMCRIWSETKVPKEDVTNLATLAFSKPNPKPHIKEMSKIANSSVKKSVSAPAMHPSATMHKPQSYTGPKIGKASKKSFKHFHISATINPSSDIPLLPSISTFDSSKCLSDSDDTGQVFTVHWLDNKYHNAMALLNSILKDAMKDEKAVYNDIHTKHSGPEGHHDHNHDDSHNPEIVKENFTQPTFSKSRPSSFNVAPVWDSTKPESVDTFLSCLASPLSPEVQEDLGLNFPPNISEELLRNWRRQSDALYAIHPNDGSLLVWHVNYLGENEFGRIRQPQVSFSSRIPMAIPAGDAATLCSRIVLYANHYSDHFSLNTTSDMSHSNTTSTVNELIDDTSDESCGGGTTSSDCYSSFINMLSKHTDGSLNQWEMMFTPNTAYSMISSIRHISRFCGHRFHLSGIRCHPTLPLLLTTAHHNKNGRHENVNASSPVKSELILWRVDPVGALQHSGGMTELTRLNGTSDLDFKEIAWFPVLFPSWCLGVESVSTSTCIVSLNENSIQIYQAVVNATKLLVEINEMFCHLNAEKSQETDILGQVISEQSSDHPGCLLQLASIELDVNIEDVISFNILQDDQFDSKPKATPRKPRKVISESFYLLLLLKSKQSSSITVKMWKINFYADQQSINVRTRRNTVQMMSDDSSEEDSYENGNSGLNDNGMSSLSMLQVTIKEINANNLNLPNGADVVTVCPASDHLTFALTNHQQRLPFTLAVSCTDGGIYFIKSFQEEPDATVFELSEIAKPVNFSWTLWNGTDNAVATSSVDVFQSPFILIQETLVSVKLADCGMLACLSFQYNETGFTSNDEVYVYLSIYDSLSSGGAEWCLQDKIKILTLSEINRAVSVDKIKDFIQLDWFFCEDGGYLLAVCIGSVVKIFSRVPVGLVWEKQQLPPSSVDNSFLWSQNIGKGNVPSYAQSAPKKNPLIKRQSTLDVVSNKKIFGPYHDRKLPGSTVTASSNLGWSQLTEIQLTNDPLPKTITLSSVLEARPVMISWVRDGFLIAATDTEMHVFCHWLEKFPSLAQPVVGIMHGDASILEHGSSGLFEHLKNHTISTADFDCFDTESMVVSIVALPDSLCPTLPQYHPLVLTELMNGGHLVAVKHILIEMARSMNGEGSHNETPVIHEEKINLKKFDLESEETIDDRGVKITPVLLYNLLTSDGQINNVLENFNANCPTKTLDKMKVLVNGKAAEDDEYNDLFNNTSGLHSEDDDDLEEFSSDERKDKSGIIHLSNHEPGYLGEEHCQVIHNYLEHNQLPGLNSLDQMELVALADTIAHGHTKQADINKSTLERSNVSATGRGYAALGDDTSAGSLDKCGLRFVLSVHNHLCLLRSLPAPQGAKLLRRGLETCQFAWAFHSDAQEEATTVIPSILRGAPDWEELRSFGIGWWMRSINTLRRIVEQTARTAFQKDNKPLDAAVYYMALNKKNVLRGLFKSVRDKRMSDFFSNNFAEDRWRKAALKNAFALMGKQRFKEAVAFFLLANSINDAIEVSIDKLGDFQLACVIVRLHCSSGEQAYHDLLKKYIIKKEDKVLSADPFIRSMTYWTLGRYTDALQTLMANEDARETRMPAKITDVFNFYNFLRTHPMLIKQRKIDQHHDIGAATDQDTDDRISLQERKLFFATAKTHLDSGCSLLALDVLSRMPPLKIEQKSLSQSDESLQKVIESGFEPPTKDEKASDVDWGAAENINTEDELELDWSEDEESSSGSSSTSESKEVDNSEMQNGIEEEATPTVTEKSAAEGGVDRGADIFTQDLRLMACMKIFVTELKAIAQACANDGQLRLQLYLWLEKETKVLHSICHGNQGCDIDTNCMPSANNPPEMAHVDDDVNFSTDSDTEQNHALKYVPSLHELYKAEKQDWKIKRDSASHRRKWLRRYQHFLRTLLSYCVLHDDAKGGLMTIRMELLLLLQESLQEKAPLQHLASPLPHPTTVPLLTSNVVSCQTVVADPPTRLKHIINDIYASILTFNEPPLQFGCDSVNSFTLSLCQQAAALSSCVYHSLCDTHTRTFRSRILDVDSADFDMSHHGSPKLHALYPNAKQSSRSRTTSANEVGYIAPNTLPSHWPGVASLQAMLNTDSTTGDNARHLIVLLCESLVCVYVTLLARGLHTCNSKLLYRLTTHNFNKSMWNALFGGGAKLVVKYAKPTHGHATHKDGGSKMREKLNRRVLTHERKSSFTSTNSDAGSYREKFVAPEVSLWDWFLSKPLEFPKNGEDFYDSDSDSSTSESSDEEVEFDSFGSGDEEEEDDPFKYYEPKEEKTNQDTEHGNRMSYSWHILRLAIIRVAIHNLKEFLPSCGLELNELGTTAPILNSILRLLFQWQSYFQQALNNFENVPESLIESPHKTVEGRPAIIQHQLILDVTPFGTDRECRAIKRLWSSLVRKEILHNMFIYFIFEKGKHQSLDEEDSTTNADEADSMKSKKPLVMNNARNNGKVKVLHKEHEIISSFCINHTNQNVVVISTTRDLLEIDLSSILASDSWSWLEEDVSTPVMEPSSRKDEDFLLVSRKASMPPQNTTAPPIYASMSPSSQTGQGGSIVLKRQNSSARRMASHPNLPYYLTGHHDGNIRMWEWGHQQQISRFTSSHQPKVANVTFTPFGNKVAAVDVEGYLTMWQVSSPKKPFLMFQSHDRTANDCCFIASSSVVATTGMSSTHRNVAVWDTLLPTRSMLIHDFTMWENVGASCVRYAPQYQSLIVAGRDGRLSAFDMRRMVEPVCTFMAHDTAIKCLSISPDDRYYVTGSVGGDMRVWDTQSHSLIYSLNGEHPRASLFRNFGSGTMQIAISEPGHQVYSCGADGTLKLRMLPSTSSQDNNLFGDPLGGRFQKLALQKQVIKLAHTVREQCMVY